MWVATDFEAVKGALLIGLAIWWFLTNGLDDTDDGDQSQ